MSKQGMLADVIDGVFAGAIATWALDKVTTVLYETESAAAREREDVARNGKTAYGVAAEKAAGAVGVVLSEKERDRYGMAIHWALGLGAGVAYSALRQRSASASRAGGLLFGTAFWLAIDETVTPALGLTKGPAAFPWQTHARGLAGHLAFGAVAEATLSAIQPAAS